jgi:multiple sugar transport system permease protein
MAMTRHEWRNIRRGLLFTSPWILGLLLFVAYPIGASLYYSFTDFSVLLPPVPVGFRNYTDLFRDDLFLKSIWNTLVYTLIALPLGIVLSLFIAVMLHEKIRFRGVFRTIYFIPSLVPLVPLGILWQWIFNSQYGIIHVYLDPLLEPLGGSTPNWLADPFWTKPALAIIRIWGIGGSMLIFLAALQDVPEELYESAEMDGASTWQKFRSITIPLLSPALYFNLIIGIIACIQIFAVPFVMTGRGPADSSYFFTMYIYDTAFRYLRMGYASAMAWIMFVLILILTILAMKIASRHVFYGGERN